MKTNKSYTDRIKVTKNGKLKARKAGKGHFNAKARRSKQLTGKVPTNFKMNNKAMARFLPGLVRKYT